MKTDDKIGQQPATLTISLRVGDPTLSRRIEELAESSNFSLNLTVNMLLGYAFNEIDRTGKKFTPKVVFESE